MTATIEPVTGFWRNGDLHFCALYALAHIADLACEERARVYGDGLYVGCRLVSGSSAALMGGNPND